jgi:hypothetical protein
VENVIKPFKSKRFDDLSTVDFTKLSLFFPQLSRSPHGGKQDSTIHRVEKMGIIVDNFKKPLFCRPICAVELWITGGVSLFMVEHGLKLVELNYTKGMGCCDDKC